MRDKRMSTVLIRILRSSFHCLVLAASVFACVEDLEIVAEFDSMEAADARVRLLAKGGVAATVRYDAYAEEYPYIVEVPVRQVGMSRAIFVRSSTITKAYVTTSTVRAGNVMKPTPSTSVFR